ncbi:hypothetical protein [uncultured Gilvimarinus sp.]|mgnify:CR=1 FL=1|uniref:hypothetical protein n=1 Tax=uncultured Gilvimarinus sp. TaxID=1689143 RepID=UPI0030DAA632
MRGFLLLLLWLVVLGQGAIIYMGYEREQALSAEVAALHKEVAALRKDVSVQRGKLAAMERQSVSAMVAKANKVIVEGWDAIVESEMTRARAALTELEAEEPIDQTTPGGAQSRAGQPREAQ